MPAACGHKRRTWDPRRRLPAASWVERCLLPLGPQSPRARCSENSCLHSCNHRGRGGGARQCSRGVGGSDSEPQNQTGRKVGEPAKQAGRPGRHSTHSRHRRRSSCSKLLPSTQLCSNQAGAAAGTAKGAAGMPAMPAGAAGGLTDNPDVVKVPGGCPHGDGCTRGARQADGRARRQHGEACN